MSLQVLRSDDVLNSIVADVGLWYAFTFRCLSIPLASCTGHKRYFLTFDNGCCTSHYLYWLHVYMYCVVNEVILIRSDVNTFSTISDKFKAVVIFINHHLMWFVGCLKHAIWQKRYRYTHFFSKVFFLIAFTKRICYSSSSSLLKHVCCSLYKQHLCFFCFILSIPNGLFYEDDLFKTSSINILEYE